MRIDHHTHIGKDTERWKFEMTVDELRSKLDQFFIDKAVVFACPNLIRKENPYMKDNEMVLEAAEKDERIIPFMFIHPYLDTLDYIENAHADFKGFKIYCNAHDLGYSYAEIYTEEKIQKVMGYQKPVLFHIAKNEGERAKDLIKIINDYSDTPIILAHCARLFDDDLKALSKYKNVFIDISPLSSLLENRKMFLAGEEYWPKEIDYNAEKDKMIGQVLDYFKVMYNGRILWGSDAPWCDHMLPEKYAGEIKVLDSMTDKGINSTFLKYLD
jgi:hypothetical protein